MNTVSHSSIDHAWMRRYQQDLFYCQKFLTHFEREDLANNDDLDLELLEVSLWRYDERRSQVFSKMLELYNRNSTRSNLQLALCYFSEGDYIKALELFDRTITVAKIENSFEAEKYLAQVNAIFCLDHLGIDFSKRIDELSAPECLSKLSVKIDQQMQVLKMRLAFRNLDDEALTDMAQINDFGGAQGLYLMHFYNKAPQVAFNKTDLCELTRHDQALIYHNYRLATLLARKSSSEGIKTTELIGRIYLWSWLWLDNQIHVELLKAPLEELSRHDLSKITIEDEDLISVSLHWLDLFISHFNAFELESFKRFKSYITQIPRYSKELETIKEIKLNRLNSHPVKGVNQKIKRFEKPCTSKNHLYVKENEVIGQKRVESASLSALIFTLNDSIFYSYEGLSGEKALSFEKVLERCFSIYEYDPIIHYQKISHLLQALKKCAPTIVNKACIKDEKILVNLDWSRVTLYEYDELVLNTPKSHKTLLDYISEDGVKRADLEKVSSLTKSTLTRELNKLIKEHQIIRTGSGRNILYKRQSL